MTEFESWVGRKQNAADLVSDRLSREFLVTLDGVPGLDQSLPGLQWCLAPEICPPDQLGNDGHPKTGIFLPNLGLPRRMWAGGVLRYSGSIHPGETITRQTTIRDINFKEGRSGRLGFVTLDKEYRCGQELRISEEQNIVYRDAPLPGAKAPEPQQADAWTCLRSFEMTTTSTQLFRFSAVTFNGHRIHYDQPYAIGEEGYAGLVVHGPLQSIWLQGLATDILGHLPKIFRYRGLAPLTCGRRVAVEAKSNNDGLSLRVRDVETNIVTMFAEAS